MPDTFTIPYLKSVAMSRNYTDEQVMQVLLRTEKNSDEDIAKIYNILRQYRQVLFQEVKTRLYRLKLSVPA